MSRVLHKKKVLKLFLIMFITFTTMLAMHDIINEIADILHH